MAGNLVVLELSNLANVGVSGNLDVLGSSNLANLMAGNLVVLELSNLANVGVSGSLDVLGTSNLANLSVGNLVVLDAGKLEFRDANTYIQSIDTGNLDIRSLYGNINITANHDIIISANTPSTIKLLGPGNSPMVAFSQDAGGNTFMSFGSTTGESGYGIKADASGNVLIKSQGASGWAGVSNTTIAIGNTSISLGNTYAGLDLSNSTGYQTSNLVGTITNSQLAGSISNDKLANSNIVIGGQTINLGGSGNLAFSNITGSLNTGTQIDNSNIANAKLANSNIVIGGQTINLGGSGNIGLSNLSDLSISGVISNHSILKYNSSISKWQTLTPQNICLLFPNASVNVGSTSMNQITLSNIGNLQYNILTSNESPIRNENSTIFRFTGFTNNFYNIGLGNLICICDVLS
jgi:hypothetical protein